jgi:predicted ATPase
MDRVNIKTINFRNYKILRNATLPLGPFRLLIGPNGSGKSTAISAISRLASPGARGQVESAGLHPDEGVSVVASFGPPDEGVSYGMSWPSGGANPHGLQPGKAIPQYVYAGLQRFRVYSLEAERLAVPVTPQPGETTPGVRGDGLAGVLDRLRDKHPERFEAFNKEVARWLPEFDRLLLDTVGQGGVKSLFMRTRHGHHAIAAHDLSQGVLVAIGILTIAYLPDSPPIVAFEEPDRGLHPRLLREVRDALYRLAFPQDFGEEREPVQVIATTHSPYMVDLFRDHLEDVVVAEKRTEGASFHRLTERPDIERILEDAQLGEAWYTGILGGVPAE